MKHRWSSDKLLTSEAVPEQRRAAAAAKPHSLNHAAGLHGWMALSIDWPPGLREEVPAGLILDQPMSAL